MNCTYSGHSLQFKVQSNSDIAPAFIHTDGGDKLKSCITENFFSQASMGTKQGWCCAHVGGEASYIGGWIICLISKLRII